MFFKKNPNILWEMVKKLEIASEKQSIAIDVFKKDIQSLKVLYTRLKNKHFPDKEDDMDGSPQNIKTTAAFDTLRKSALENG